MNEQLKSGQRVTVNSFGGKKLLRVVVEDRSATILICKPEEFDRAKAENRRPVAVGFPRQDVMVSGEQ